MNSNLTTQPPPVPQEKFWVVLQSGYGVDSELWSVIVTADTPHTAKEKALCKRIAKDYPRAVYWETAAMVAHGIGVLRTALAADPTKEGYWCLIRDDSDNSFVGVHVTASSWDEAGQAAVDSRKKDSGITQASDGCFVVAITQLLSQREGLLKQLTTRRKRG